MKLILSACSYALAVMPGSAQPADEFFKDKTITLIVGATEGGAFSVYARAMADAMPQYLPGNPRIVVQSMPGAGGTVMANYMYNVAPKNGLTIGTPMVTMPITQMLEPQNIKYDSTKFRWIGNLDGSSTVTLVAWHETPFKTFEDVKAKQMVVASSGTSSATYQMPALMNYFFGTNIKIVTGYRGQSDIDIAVMRGEVHGRAAFYNSFLSSRRQELESGEYRVVAQISADVPASLRGVTNLIDIAPTEEARQVLELFALQGAVASRAFLAPPGIPEDRLAVLRAAFDRVIVDPAFIEMMKKRNLTFEPMSGAAVQKGIERLIATPKHIIEKLTVAVR